MQQGVGVVVVFLTLASASMAAEGPVPVSPGAQIGMAVLGNLWPEGFVIRSELILMPTVRCSRSTQIWSGIWERPGIDPHE